MTLAESILIVEDEEEWCRAYQRAVAATHPGQVIRVAKSFASAARLIEDAVFALAFIDIGLDVTDDRNIDGLRVMEKIRTVGDETSLIVVTGRSGSDVLLVTRDAIKKYGAYDAVSKRHVDPTDLRRLLAGGIEEYRRAVAESRQHAHNVLCGSDVVWEDQIMRATGFRGSVTDFYAFLGKLFDHYLPVRASHQHAPARIADAQGSAYAVYWSRAIAARVLVCFGSATTFDEALPAIWAEAGISGDPGVREPAEQLVRHGMKGAVFLL